MQGNLNRPPADEAAELRRRQRGRNLVLLAVLLFLSALFYAIAMVKFRVS